MAKAELMSVGKADEPAVVVDFQVSPELVPLANPNLMALSGGSILQDLDKLPENQFRPPTFPFDRSSGWQPVTIVSARSPQEAL
jgi:microcystin degradation protein MlrC